MVITFLFVILFLSLVAYLARRRRVSFLFAACFLCGIFLFGTGFLPGVLLRSLQTHERLQQASWQKQSAIFLLGSGGIRRSLSGEVTSSIFGFSRVFEAARLFHDCQKKGGSCVIVPCGGNALKLGITEAETMKHELMSVGVPEAAILLETKSRNTFQNAFYSRDLIQGKGFEQLILVTSGVHMKRAMELFRFFEMNVLPSPSDELQTVHSVFPKAANFFAVDAALHEILGMMRFRFYNLMDWNKKPAKKVIGVAE